MWGLWRAGLGSDDGTVGKTQVHRGTSSLSSRGIRLKPPRIVVRSWYGIAPRLRTAGLPLHRTLSTFVHTVHYTSTSHPGVSKYPFSVIIFTQFSTLWMGAFMTLRTVGLRFLRVRFMLMLPLSLVNRSLLRWH